MSGTICLITGGPIENIGKTVYVVGTPNDPRLPNLGGTGHRWDVQMVSSELIGPGEDGYLRGDIGQDSLMPLNFTMEEALAMREKALADIVARAMTELLKEDWWGESPE